MIKKTVKIKDLIPDSKNFNKHTSLGMTLLEKSMSQHGFMEAGVISEDGVIISGNARQETAVNIGIEDVQIIDTDGKRAIYLRATGVKSGTKEFSELAMKLNQVGKMNVLLDAELIEAELSEAVCVEWGIEIDTDYSDKNKEIDVDGMDDEMIIKLKYTEDEYNIVKEMLSKIAATPEQAVWKLLGNE